MCPVVEERAPASVSKPQVSRARTGGGVSMLAVSGFETGPGGPSSTTEGGPGRSRWLRSERQRASRNHRFVRVAGLPQPPWGTKCSRWLRSERQRASRNHRFVVPGAFLNHRGGRPGRLETTGSGFDRLNRREFGLLPGLRREPVMTGAATGPSWQAGLMTTREQPWSDEGPGGGRVVVLTRNPIAEAIETIATTAGRAVTVIDERRGRARSGCAGRARVAGGRCGGSLRPRRPRCA